MGIFMLNGKMYMGLINAQGLFVDTSRVVQAETGFVGSYSYTATEDCFVYFYLVNKANSTTYIYIDGQPVGSLWRSSEIPDTASFYLKRGQTISVADAHATYTSYITVYGIQMGSPVTFLSEYASACYDMNEREVGCWVDGKPIYQKTIKVTSSASSNTVNAPHGISDIDNVIKADGWLRYVGANDERRFVPQFYYSDFGTYAISIYEVTDTDIVIAYGNWLKGIGSQDIYVTLQYTKTTDTAGSGTLTPTAMPTKHYVEDEQVIGTFLGKPLYEKVYEFSSTLSVAYSSFTNTTIDSTNLETIVSAIGMHADGTSYGTLLADPTRNSHTLLGLQTPRNGSEANLKRLILQYTKITD